jgi:hypothetical protein
VQLCQDAISGGRNDFEPTNLTTYLVSHVKKTREWNRVVRIESLVDFFAYLYLVEHEFF